MKKVLVVEDTRLFSNLLKRRIEAELALEAVVVANMAEAVAVIGDQPEKFFLALLDLNLPDAPHGEVVARVTGLGIPAVIVAASFEADEREEMTGRVRVIDYVIKESPASLDYVIALVRRIDRNRDTVVMVVDDSRSSRAHIAHLLRTHQYQVLEAEDGERALVLLREHPDVKLIVTDYTMPKMDGFELVKRVRQRHSKDKIAIIGVSANGNQRLSARFIKHGANDFINKPFLEEEFHCRVTQNVEMLELLQSMRDASVRDYLTGLHNRRYYFDTGGHLFASAQRGQLKIAVAVIDIDFFKRVNDTYGHDAGDEVLKRMARILKDHFRLTDVVARFGGEEFCILLINLDPEAAVKVFEELRKEIEAEVIQTSLHTIRITASIGVCCALRESLQAMLNVADEMLYRAKKGGRNQVVVAECD